MGEGQQLGKETLEGQEEKKDEEESKDKDDEGGEKDDEGGQGAGEEAMDLDPPSPPRLPSPPPLDPPPFLQPPPHDPEELRHLIAALSEAAFKRELSVDALVWIHTALARIPSQERTLTALAATAHELIANSIAGQDEENSE